MKSIIKIAFIILVINIVLFSEIISAKNAKSKNRKAKKAKKAKKQVHLIKDENGFKSGINHVVRRNPTVSVSTKLGAHRLEAPSNFIHASNSNTSNGPNVGFLGRSAELVGKILNLLIFIFLLDFSFNLYLPSF